MGGRGTYAAGNNVEYTYKTVDKIEGVKVLSFISQSNRNKLPEEAHSSDKYILIDRNGVFHQYREYDSSHRLIFEIGYHFESGLSKNGESVLHAHSFDSPGVENRSKARLLTDDELKKYKKYFKGVKNI
ncbi:MAG: hypothetical protein LUH08_05865 [Ruminococcus sp.]|nr:hypothetical protein [Ruminococcus sp.]